MTLGVLGPYELRGELGRGAMAIVWRGYDTRLDREVAIKEPVLPAGIDDATREEFGARFIREGRAAAGLNHPGIVTIYTADTYDSRPVIVMELIEGETLSATLDRGPLSPGAAMAAADQLLDAIGYAHGKGIVHRDIKPDNIFVTRDGRIKLTDFGIAHVGTTATLTQAGTVMGTPGYMAPEQVLGQSTDARADLFAAGAVFHEMLTGTNAFGATDGVAPTTVMYRIVHEPVTPLPVSLAGSVPEWTEPVIARSMAKDPDARFASAAEMRAALRGEAVPAAGVGIPTMVVSGGVPQTPAPGGKPKWLPYAAVAGVGTVIIVALLATSSPGGSSAGQVASGAGIAPAAAPETVPAASAPEPEPTPTGPSSAQLESEIRDMLEGWRMSRQNLDYYTYISFYTADFVSAEGKNYAQWIDGKERIYATTDPPTITFETPSIQLGADGSSATVSVRQTYYSAKINESMTKNLTLRRESGTWKIISENS